MNECIGLLGKATIFSTLDAGSVCLQNETVKVDRDQTALVIMNGLCWCIRRVFGLKKPWIVSAGSRRHSGSCQMTIHVNLYRRFHHIFYLTRRPYRTWSKVLGGDREFQKYSEVRKYLFFSKAIEYLGHFIIPGELQQVPNKTKDIIKTLKYPIIRLRWDSFQACESRTGDSCLNSHGRWPLWTNYWRNEHLIIRPEQRWVCSGRSVRTELHTAPNSWAS